jgi:stage III sporulation protein AG
VRDICDKVAGVSNVSVLLTLESSNEYVYAENSSGASVYDYLVINGKDGEEPVLIKEIYASVRGIAIVCDGGDSAKIKATLTELLSSAFNLRQIKYPLPEPEDKDRNTQERMLI